MTEAARATRDRFEALNLADCRLIGVQLRRRDGSRPEAIELDLLLIAGANADHWRPARLRFLRPAWVDVKMDLWAKGACGDSIDSSLCRHDPQSIKAALHEYNEVRAKTEPLDILLLFVVELCSPSGRVQVVAQDFELDESDGTR